MIQGIVFGGVNFLCIAFKNFNCHISIVITSDDMVDSSASSVKSFLILTQALPVQSSHTSAGLPPSGILELC
jgi:hypothetical protein